MVKYFDPSYYIRSVQANAADSLLCEMFARCAAHAALAGKTDLFIVLCNNRPVHVPLRESLHAEQFRDLLDPFRLAGHLAVLDVAIPDVTPVDEDQLVERTLKPCSDAAAAGILTTVELCDSSDVLIGTYTGTTDENGLFPSKWIRSLNPDDYTAEVVDLAHAA